MRLSLRQKRRAAVRFSRSALSAWACLGLAVLTAGGCVSSPTSDTRPNVLLITVDTLRTDHLGIYGYSIDTSPNIDALGRAGTVVERCISSAPETAPGTATLLTGLYQDEHTVAYNRRQLPPDVTTLAEHLSEAGYATAGFTGNFLVGPKFGFDQGFEEMATFQHKSPYLARDPLGTAAALEWLDRQRSKAPNQPWFLWVHYMDPHGPYLPADTSWSDRIDYDPARFGDDTELEISESNFGLGVIPKYQGLPKLNRPSQYVRRYDGEIRATDAEIGRLVAGVNSEGQPGNSLVVFTADHGESLVEHDEYFQHGWFLYDTTLRIPLIFHQPGVIESDVRISAQTSAVDLVPTILELVGIDTAELRSDGRSIADTLRTGRPFEERPAYSYGPRDNHPFAISTNGYKLIHTPAAAPATQGGGSRPGVPERYELYAIEDDPGELNELDPEASEHAELKKRLLETEAAFRHRLWERIREVEKARRARQAAAN